MPEAAFDSKKRDLHESGAEDISHLSLESVGVSDVGKAIAFCNFEGGKNCAYWEDAERTRKWLNKNFDSKEAEEWKGKLSVFNSTYMEFGKHVYPAIALLGSKFTIVKQNLDSPWTMQHRLVIKK